MKPDSVQKWNLRSNHYEAAAVRGDYVDQFLALLDIQPGETVLDMGCGNGLLAVPLAKDGHRVVAADFSEGMLEKLAAKAAQAGVDVQTIHMSWEDDWTSFGVQPQSVDIAFASRSVITEDVSAAMMKLTATAKKRAVATLSTGANPRSSAAFLRELGVVSRLQPDFQVAFNALVAAGYRPSISYIKTDRRATFATQQDARNYLESMVMKTDESVLPQMRTVALSRIDTWLEANLQPNEYEGRIDKHGNAEGAWAIERRNDVVWAYLSWDK